MAIRKVILFLINIHFIRHTPNPPFRGQKVNAVALLHWSSHFCC